MRLGRCCLYLLPLAAAMAQAAEPVATAPAFKFVPQKLTPADRKTVGRLYAQSCSGCHGASGEGAGNGLSLYGAKDAHSSAAAMHFGRSEPPPLKTVMPAYGAQDMLTQKEIAQLAAYIADFRPPWP